MRLTEVTIPEAGIAGISWAARCRMAHPPDPEMQRPAARHHGTIAKSYHQGTQRYSISVETQACLSILLPIVSTIVLLAIGARL